MRLALFDAQSGRRISEDFHVDLNDPALRKMTPPPQGFMKAGPHPLSQSATSATEVGHVVGHVVTEVGHVFAKGSHVVTVVAVR